MKIAGEDWEASLQLLVNVGTLVIVDSGRSVPVAAAALGMLAALFLRTRRTMPSTPRAHAAK
ncbi:MAG: hypothetical protein M3437_14160 [Chloroflexota bacterium]|nr:hypothetical protein [Chloroflexota bacterium]MDQ5866392.1 hypothetical protein [Chloroflexota bacterium]